MSSSEGFSAQSPYLWGGLRDLFPLRSSKGDVGHESGTLPFGERAEGTLGAAMLVLGHREALVCVSCVGVSSRMTLSSTWPDWCKAEAASSGLALSATWLDGGGIETVSPGETAVGTTVGGPAKFSQ